MGVEPRRTSVQDPASGSSRAAGTTRTRPEHVTDDAQLDQLRFIHDVARLATTARTWDELLETVIDRTRDVLHADVSSLYLLDRDGAYLTLAATNGLDRFQIGRARVPFGEGVTGIVAAERRPLVIPDVKADPRFLWVRGIDQRRVVASMLSVPLTWHDQIVGGRVGIGRLRRARRTTGAMGGTGRSDARHWHHHTSLEKGCGRKGCDAVAPWSRNGPFGAVA